MVEENAFQKVGIGTQGKVLQIEETKKEGKGWWILVCFLESRARFSTRGRSCKHRWIVFFRILFISLEVFDDVSCLIHLWVMRMSPLPDLPLFSSLECNVPEKQGKSFCEYHRQLLFLIFCILRFWVSYPSPYDLSYLHLYVNEFYTRASKNDILVY